MPKILTSLIILVFVTTTLFGQWVSKATALKKRSEVSSVAYNGKLYVFFGFADSSLNIEPTAEVYDPATNTWQFLNSLPSNKAVTHQGVALIDDNVWHIGGRVGKNPGPLTSEIWVYNITSNSWSPGPQIRDPATGEPILWAAGGAAFLGRTLHIFGGFIINACTDQETYHLTLNIDDWLANPQAAFWKNELSPLPIKRNHFGTAVLGGKIYAIGGQFGHDCDGGLDKQYSHVYNPSTDTWTELPLLPAPRSHIEGGTFAIDGKIYLVAGQGTNGISTNKVTIFDPSGNNGTGSWIDDTNLTLPTGYEGVSAKVINTTFIIDHGGEGSSKKPRNTAYSRTLLRTPVYKLGFSSGCANLKALSGNSAKAKTLLFTIDGNKSYSISSDTSWLTITKNASGIAIPNGVDVEITANSVGLAPGNYSATITATGTGNGPEYAPASYCINFIVSATAGTLQAEQAVLYKAVVASNQLGFTGTGFADYVNNFGDYVEWTLNNPSLGPVSLNFRYANGSSTNRPLKLEINGGVETDTLAFPPTGGWTKWSIAAYTGMLDFGINKIKLTAIGSSGANIDQLAWRDTFFTPVSGVLEAELALLNKAVVASNQPGFTGTGFADYINSTGDFIEWTLDKTKTDPVSLNFRYANGSTINRPLKLEVNGVVATSNLAFPPTNGWGKWSFATYTANLISGPNKIKLTAIGSSGPNIDHLAWNDIFSSLSAPLRSISVVPEDSTISSVTKNLTSSVIPNPVSGNAKLLLGIYPSMHAEIVIVDVLGRAYKNLSFKHNDGYLHFSVNELPSGPYFIIVKQGSKWATARFVVQK